MSMVPHACGRETTFSGLLSFPRPCPWHFLFSSLSFFLCSVGNLVSNLTRELSWPEENLPISSFSQPTALHLHQDCTSFLLLQKGNCPGLWRQEDALKSEMGPGPAEAVRGQPMCASWELHLLPRGVPLHPPRTDLGEFKNLTFPPNSRVIQKRWSKLLTESWILSWWCEDNSQTLGDGALFN